MRLAGRVALVTGAGRGIGEQVARAFCREGASVVLAARTASEIGAVAADLKAQEMSALAVPADVREEQSVRSLFQRAREVYGEVDILVNNAGVNFVRPFLDIEPREWDNLIRTNLRGPFLCCREALKEMIPRRRGVILNVSSGLGRQACTRLTAYCASKFALEGFCRALALETESYGIRVNNLHPGGVARTALGVATAEGIASFAPVSEDRWVPADILCEPAVYLASDEGAHWTGQSVNAREWSAGRPDDPSRPPS